MGLGDQVLWASAAFAFGAGVWGILNGFYPENQWSKIFLFSQGICIVGSFKIVPLFTGALTVFSFLASRPARRRGNIKDAEFTRSHFGGFL